MDPDNEEDKKEEVRSMLGDRAADLLEDEAGGNTAASGTRNTGGVSASHEPQGGSESTDAERSVRDED